MTLILEELYILPPNAVARVGGADEPVESYVWVPNTDPHGGSHIMIKPDVSLRIAADGSAEPYVTTIVNFKDANGEIRPVAPFFELWATVRDADTSERQDRPMNLALMEELGVTTSHFGFAVTAANRKAERRTGSPTCAFIARVRIHGDDHQPHSLLAISPHTSGQVPLVPHDRPIPLGSVQVLRPVDKPVLAGADPSILRVRFTPPSGAVYGPPMATKAPASPVVPGLAEAHITDYGRIHEIVPPENRFLNADTPWSQYVMLNGEWEDSQPQDGYDGANVGDSRSWSVVDDTSDGELIANVAWRHRRFEARARFFTGPPDYAPDRRPVYSIADDLAERELPPPSVGIDDFEAVIEEVVDLFQRAFETSSMLNLDAARTRAIQENLGRLGGDPPPVAQPKFGPQSFTKDDIPYVDVTPELVVSEQSDNEFGPIAAPTQLPYTEVMEVVHGPLMQREQLISFLRRRGPHVHDVVRPPFGTTADWPVLPIDPAHVDGKARRDPRQQESKLHDMRMPPYMRDANFFALSIGRRQYALLLGLIDLLSTPGVAITTDSITGVSSALRPASQTGSQTEEVTS